LYLREQDKPKAEQTLRKAVEDIPDSEDAPEVLKDYYLRTGQADTAESVFADLTAKNPKSFPIKMTYATILAGKGDYAKLTPLTDELSKTNANNPRVQVLKGVLLLHDGKVNEAFDLLQAAVKNDQQDVQLQLALARVAEMKGDRNTATTSFRAAEKLAPGNIEVQIGLAGLANQIGDAAMLSQIADKTLAMHPEFAQAYLWRGIAESSQKQYEKAETDLQTALTKSPNSASVYTALGQLRLRQNHFPEGTAMLEKALEKDPNEVTALNNIVEVDLSQKQPDKALARVQQQIAKSPKNPVFYTMLGSLQLRQKDFNGARDNGKKAMDMNPSDESAVNVYASAVTALGNNDEAIATWEKWSAAHPKDGDTLARLGVLEDAKGNQSKAIDYYKKALQINPTQGLAANNLAYAMVSTGQNVDLALSYAQTARRVLPNSPDTADTLGWVYYNKGTYYSARDLFEEALKTSPDNASINYHLGMTYNKLGKKADAVTHLKKAVAVDPNSQTGKDAAKQLAQLG
jgi:tetratricopeptide (TPR) repeat protein